MALSAAHLPGSSTTADARKRQDAPGSLLEAARSIPPLGGGQHPKRAEPTSLARGARMAGRGNSPGFALSGGACPRRPAQAERSVASVAAGAAVRFGHSSKICQNIAGTKLRNRTDDPAS